MRELQRCAASGLSVEPRAFFGVGGEAQSSFDDCAPVPAFDGVMGKRYPDLTRNLV